MRLVIFGLLLAPIAQASNDDLLSIYQDALKSNPALQSAQAALSAAQFDIESANAGLQPKLNASANATAGETLRSNSPSSVESGYSSVDGAISASIALWGPTEQAAISVAKAGSALAETSAKSTLNQLQIDIASAYLDRLNAETALDAAQAQEQAVARQLDRAKKRLEVGLGTRVEVDQTQAAYDNVRVGLIRAQDSVADANDALASVAGRPVERLARLQEQYRALPSTLSLETVIEQAISNSSAITSITQSLELAQARLALAQAGEQPRLDASGSYSTNKSLEGGLWGNGYSAKLTLSYPLYTGGKTEADIASAAAKVSEAKADLDQQRRDLTQQARSLYRAISTQAKTVSAQAQSIKSAETAVEATEAAFEVGSGDIIDVLNAQSDLFSAQSDFAQSRHQHALLVLQLEQLRGDLNDDDLVALNQQLTP